MSSTPENPPPDIPNFSTAVWLKFIAVIFGIAGSISLGTFTITKYANDELEKALREDIVILEKNAETANLSRGTLQKKLEDQKIEHQEQLDTLQEALDLERNKRKRRSFEMIQLGPEGHVARAYREFVREAHVGILFQIKTLQDRTYSNLRGDFLFDVRSVKNQVGQLLSWCDLFLEDAKILADYPESEMDHEIVDGVKSHREELTLFASRLDDLPDKKEAVSDAFKDELLLSIRTVNSVLQRQIQKINGE